MSATILGCVKDAPLWFWNEKNPGYNDFLLDFVETFSFKYLQHQPLKSANIYSVIRAISDYRIQFGTNQTTRLTELTDQNMVQKCLNIVLGLQTLSNQYVIRQRDMRKLSYDEDDETITMADSYQLRFATLPSEEVEISAPSDYPSYLFGDDHSNLVALIKGWWFKSWSKKLGFFNSNPVEAKQILKDHGCLCRYLIRIQPAQKRQRFECSVFEQILKIIDDELERQRTAALDIYSIEYKVFKNIPFFVDYDLLRVILMRRHPSIIYSGQPRFMPSDDNQFVFVNNKPVNLSGWEDYIQSAFSDSEEEDTGNWVITSSFENDALAPKDSIRKRKYSHRQSTEVDILHARLGNCSIGKRNATRTSPLDERKLQQAFNNILNNSDRKTL